MMPRHLANKVLLEDIGDRTPKLFVLPISIGLLKALNQFLSFLVRKFIYVYVCQEFFYRLFPHGNQLRNV